jgi:hypothetical protein
LGAALALEACVLFVPDLDIGPTCRFAGDTTSACGTCIDRACGPEVNACCGEGACASALVDLEACAAGACNGLVGHETSGGTAGRLAGCAARSCTLACALGLDVGEANAEGGAPGATSAGREAGDARAEGADAPSSSAQDAGGPLLYCSHDVDLCVCRTTPFDASTAGRACNGAAFGGTPDQVSCCATPDWPSSGKCSCVPVACVGASTTSCTCAAAPLDQGTLTSCTGTCCIDNQNGDNCACFPDPCPSGYTPIEGNSCTGAALRCPIGQLNVTACTG